MSIINCDNCGEGWIDTDYSDNHYEVDNKIILECCYENEE
jgi:hypothetical protein